MDINEQIRLFAEIRGKLMKLERDIVEASEVQKIHGGMPTVKWLHASWSQTHYAVQSMDRAIKAAAKTGAPEVDE